MVLNWFWVKEYSVLNIRKVAVPVKNSSSPAGVLYAYELKNSKVRDG